MLHALGKGKNRGIHIPKTIFKIIDRIAKVDAEAYELYETLSLTRDEDAEINENDLDEIHEIINE